MNENDLAQPLIRPDDGGFDHPDLALASNAWKFLIVDDDPPVHEITEIALKGFRFQERPLHFQHACASPVAERLLGDEDIHLYGRIVAVADVFDSVLSTRCYTTAWEFSEVVNQFRQQRSRHFDPRLTGLLLEHLDQFTAIRDADGSDGKQG